MKWTAWWCNSQNEGGPPPAPRNAAEVPILSGGDVRDLLIAQQVRRIDELEREVAALRAELHRK